MTEPLDFYFDFSSPYGYLMSEKIDAVAAAHGRKVRWHPVLLGVIFQATGSRPPVDGVSAKATYMFNDFHRSARHLGIPYNPPSRFPLPTQNAARAYYWLHGQPVRAPEAPKFGMVRVQDHTGRFIGIGEVSEDGRIAPRRLIRSE